MAYHLSSKQLIQIGKSMRKIRENRDRTQEEVAAEAGIEMSYYSKIERGEANPSLEIMYAIVKALHVNSSEIFPF